jgi:hypothetical protein
VQTYVKDFDESWPEKGWIFNPFADSEKVHFTGTPQLGTFIPSSPAFQGQKTAWSILTQYLNPTVNEIYTAIRTNPSGKLFPTMVLRQLPFSTNLASRLFIPKLANAKRVPDQNEEAGNEVVGRVQIATFDDEEGEVITGRPNGFDIPVTYFSELPRWIVHPTLIRSFNIGRSDSLRFNFIHVQGETGQKGGVSQTGALVRDPPLRDELDIARSGLRPYMRTVPCGQQDIVNHGAGAWMQLLADFLMGQHLTLTGQMETVGIQAPICPGDNVEFDDTLLHIEGVTHSFTSDGAGNRRFYTSLSLTHGMSTREAQDDTSIYSGVFSGELEQLDPGTTVTKDLQSDAPTDPPGIAGKE